MPAVNEIFANMSSQYKPDRAAGFDATIQFDLSGDDGGAWAVSIGGDGVNVAQGQAENPTATIRMAASDFVAMTSGELNAVNAFMMGKIKVEGDLNAVMKFQTLFGM